MNEQDRLSMENAWAEALSRAKAVTKAYDALLAASDSLAEAIGYDDDYMLMHVLPKRAGQRRQAGLLLAWMMKNKGFIRSHLADEVVRLRVQREQAVLLDRLNLSPEEMELLGIKPPITPPTTPPKA